jgi:hypothetical protein
MKRIVDIDILKGCLSIMKKFLIVQEFSGSKVSSYDKAIYNELKKIINSRKNNELFK